MKRKIICGRRTLGGWPLYSGGLQGHNALSVFYYQCIVFILKTMINHNIRIQRPAVIL